MGHGMEVVEVHSAVEVGGSGNGMEVFVLGGMGNGTEEVG